MKHCEIKQNTKPIATKGWWNLFLKTSFCCYVNSVVKTVLPFPLLLSEVFTLAFHVSPLNETRSSALSATLITIPSITYVFLDLFQFWDDSKKHVSSLIIQNLQKSMIFSNFLHHLQYDTKVLSHSQIKMESNS